jgi:hypothetical protein
MIERKHFNNPFRQTGYTRILASYALDGEYFCKTPLRDFFRDYIIVNFPPIANQVKNSQNWLPICYLEAVYDCTFHVKYNTGQGLGIELIHRMHNENQCESFIKFNTECERCDIKSVLAESGFFETSLRDSESVLIAAYEGGDHTSLFAMDGAGLYRLDTKPNLGKLVWDVRTGIR